MSPILPKHPTTALVTGAAGGIGRAAVAQLIASGSRVIAVDRDKSALERLADEQGSALTIAAVDLADAGAIADLLVRVLADRPVDILVNNAGILTSAKLKDTTLEDWHRIMAINLDAAMLLTKGCLPGMRAAGWGRIVNVASYAWKSGGLTASTAYSVSKAALVGLTFSTARETTAEGITANAIAPAYVASPMITAQLSEADRQRQIQAIPMHRFCAAEEVAHAIGFLASPLSGFITGTVIDMNGGLQFG